MYGTSDRVGSWLNFAQKSRDQGGLGLAPHQAAGLVGNLVNESGRDLNPWGPTGDNGTAWGTAQWRGDRLTGLQNYAKTNGLDPRSMEAQQGWMRNEFDGPEARAYAALQGAKSPEDAARAVDAYYERSDGSTRGKREASARALMAQFGGGDPGSTGALSFADTGDGGDLPPNAEPTSGMLSADNTLGPGALSGRLMEGTGGANRDRVAEALTGMGAALSGISSPQQAYALNQQLAAMKKDGEDKYKVAIGKNGEIIRVDQDGNVDVAGGNGTGGKAAPTMLGDPSKTGSEYLATLPPVAQGQVQMLIEGKMAPPTGYAMSKPEVQQLISAAHQVDPTFDETAWKSRFKMASDIGSSGPSSLGGILSNGMSAFRHLGLTSDRLVDVGNGNDVMGSGLLGQGVNYLGNTVGANSAKQDKLAAATTALGRYGAESTKFYAGTGGGVHERAEALKANDPKYTTGGQQAGYIEAERDLMMERLREKEAQVRSVMGEGYLKKHPIIDSPELQQQLEKINANISKLRGVEKKPASSSKDRPSLNSLIPLNQ